MEARIKRSVCENCPAPAAVFIANASHGLNHRHCDRCTEICPYLELPGTVAVRIDSMARV